MNARFDGQRLGARLGHLRESLDDARRQGLLVALVRRESGNGEHAVALKGGYYFIGVFFGLPRVDEHLPCSDVALTDTLRCLVNQ